MRLDSAAACGRASGDRSTGVGATMRLGAGSGSRSSEGVTFRLDSEAVGDGCSGARSTGAGAMNRVGVKSGSCFREAERFDSPRKSGERSRNRSHSGGTMGRVAFDSNSSSAGAGAAEVSASGSAAGERSVSRSGGAGAINRGGGAISWARFCGGGAMERFAP